MAISPRAAVMKMAPYDPPTGNRIKKLRLDFNENTVGCSPRVLERLCAELSSEALSVYPDYARVKHSLARYFGVKANNFLLTNGTDEAIQLLIHTYIDAGDEIVALRPSYAMYKFYAQVADASLVEVNYELPKLEFPLEALLGRITSETRAILIGNPNNPTGTALGLEGIERVLAAAPDGVVLIDEAYFEFCGLSALSLVPVYSNLFVTRTFSKAFGMAGMRIGCIFSQSKNIAYLHKAQSPYSVNGPAVLAAETAIEDEAYVTAYVKEALASRELLTSGLIRLGIQYVPSSANFVLGYFGDRAIEICDTLRESAILVRDRSYEIPGAVRITVGTLRQAESVLAALERIW